MYVFTYVFTGGVSKDQLFLHAFREMDSISFPWQMTRVFEGFQSPYKIWGSD